MIEKYNCFCAVELINGSSRGILLLLFSLSFNVLQMQTTDKQHLLEKNQSGALGFVCTHLC